DGEEATGTERLLPLRVRVAVDGHATGGGLLELELELDPLVLIGVVVPVPKGVRSAGAQGSPGRAEVGGFVVGPERGRHHARIVDVLLGRVLLDDLHVREVLREVPHDADQVAAARLRVDAAAAPGGAAGAGEEAAAGAAGDGGVAGAAAWSRAAGAGRRPARAVRRATAPGRRGIRRRTAPGDRHHRAHQRVTPKATHQH